MPVKKFGGEAKVPPSSNVKSFICFMSLESSVFTEVILRKFRLLFVVVCSFCFFLCEANGS